PANICTPRLRRSGLAASVLLRPSGASFAAQQVNLTAGPATATLPDGSAVPMWGYSCGTIVSGSTATCSAANPAVVTTAASTTAPAVMSGWSPVVITVPTGQDLQINLANNLSFTPTGSTTPNNIPTSLVIVGQLGGGLGNVSQRTTTTSPTHAAQNATWPIAGDATGPQNIPPS